MSAAFNTENLEKKLIQLNDSQQSIQTLSLWLIHHRKHHKSVVQTWYKSLRQGMSIVSNVVRCIKCGVFCSNKCNFNSKRTSEETNSNVPGKRCDTKYEEERT